MLASLAIQSSLGSSAVLTSSFLFDIHYVRRGGHLPQLAKGGNEDEKMN
jgi:hypothetical protein